MSKLKKKASSKRKVQSQSHVRSFAAMEEQIAMLEEKIAALSAESKAQSAERRVENENISALCSLNSALPRIKLSAPTIQNMNAIGSSFMRVSWSTVTNAKGYLVQYSPDSAFVNDVHGVVVDAPGASVTLSGLKADTMYHVKVKAIAFDGDTDSDFSMAYLVRTGVASNVETVTHLQGWFDDLQTMFENVATLVPQLESTELNTTDRRRLNGSGVRRYGFIEKTADVAEDFPQFWPAIVDDKENLNVLVQEIEVLRNLLIWFRYASRVTGDLLLIAGDQAFRLAGAYYAAARDGARRKNPEAQQVFQMLRSFWQRRNRMSAEPTKKEVLRDVRGLMRGTKEGSVYIENEGDTVTKGKRTFVDNTRKKPRNNFKEIETGIAEFRDQSEE